MLQTDKGKRSGLTWEEHVKLGQELKDIHDRLTRISVEIPNHLGLKCKAGKKARATLKELSALKCELDNIVIKAFPEEDLQVLSSVYYGRGDDARA